MNFTSMYISQIFPAHKIKNLTNISRKYYPNYLNYNDATAKFSLCAVLYLNNKNDVVRVNRINKKIELNLAGMKKRMYVSM